MLPAQKNKVDISVSVLHYPTPLRIDLLPPLREQ